MPLLIYSYCNIGNKANPNYCSAFGVTIPALKLSPKAATVRPDGIGKVYYYYNTD